MHRGIRAFAAVALSIVTGSSAFAAPAPATTQSSEPSLQIYSVRIGRGRNNNEIQKRFAGRLYNESNAGVAMSLMMTLNDDSVFLSPGREAVSIDTFVDDTYENLLGGPSENRYSGQSPAVSVDGKSMMITLGSSRPPTDEAGRVFVRGSVQTRVSRGTPAVSTGKMMLKAGEQVEVGPFKTSLRSISDNGQNVSLQLTVTGDAGRIRRVRILGKDGRKLSSDAYDNRGFEYHSGPDQPATYNASIPPAQDEVTVEYTHVEKAEDVRIPFEAQVDVGVTKAGPVQAAEPKPAGPRGASGTVTPRGARATNVRPWPPPPVGSGVAGSIELPQRRAPFDPSAAASATQPIGPQKIKLNNTAVDVFALTIAKPRPEENKDAKWSNPPAPTFHATGYTVARLMLSTPDASILAVPPDGIEISRFEDDKAGKLDTAVYGQSYGGGFGGTGRGNVAFISPDGQQALLNVSLVSAPTPGATKCTLGGTVKARVARGERTDASEPVALEPDRNIKVGPAEIRIAFVRQQPMQTPGFSGRPTYELALQVGGKLDKLRSVELVNPATGVAFVNSLSPTSLNDLRDASNPLPLSFGFAEPPPEKVIVRVRHFAEADVVSVPFEVTTGIGL